MKSPKTDEVGRIEFYTVAQLAELLQLTEMTIYRMVERGDLPHYKIGRIKRFSTADVEVFLESHRQIGGKSGQSRDKGHSTRRNPTSPQAKAYPGVKNMTAR
jgi:excisionase family DNA binding protein